MKALFLASNFILFFISASSQGYSNYHQNETSLLPLILIIVTLGFIAVLGFSNKHRR